MESFFSLDPPDEATRRLPFVQQISSFGYKPVAKVQTMPAEPLSRLSRDTRSARAAAVACPGAGASGSVPW